MATTETGRVAASAGPTTTEYTPRIGRIPIRFLAPQQPENRWLAKAYVGEAVPFSATIFREGHDRLGGALLLTDPREIGRASCRERVLAGV